MKPRKSSWNIKDPKIVIRRVAAGAKPFIWEIHEGETMIPLQVSQQRFKSMQEAYQAGGNELKAQMALIAASQPPKPRRAMTPLSAQDFENDDDLAEELDGEELADMDLSDYPANVGDELTTTS